MQVNIGTKIKELRKRDNRTQDAMANAIGVTAQAISRWEANGGYPDMEIIPSIANYFGITIDELFGYECERDKMVDEIISRVQQSNYKYRGDDDWVDENITILREGLWKFPQNEKLLISLADVLCEAGWRRHKEWLYYDDEGYIQYHCDIYKKNLYWTECVAICEKITEESSNSDIRNSAIAMLVMLNRNFGEFEKAVKYAEYMPHMFCCRELSLCSASDGKAEAKYIGEALLTMAGHFANQLVYGLINNKHHYESDLPIEKIKGAISIFNLLCDNSNYGEYNGNLIELYLYLSRVQWERGYHDDAFVSLDNAYNCAKEYEAVCDGDKHYYSGILTKEVSYCASQIPISLKADNLPNQWPVWTNPDCTEVEKEMKSDPRWVLWVEKCKNELSI